MKSGVQGVRTSLLSKIFTKKAMDFRHIFVTFAPKCMAFVSGPYAEMTVPSVSPVKTRARLPGSSPEKIWAVSPGTW